MWARCDPDDEWDHLLARVLAGGAVPRRFPIDAIRRRDGDMAWEFTISHGG